MVKWLVNGKLCKRSYPNRPLTQRRETGKRRHRKCESVKTERQKNKNNKKQPGRAVLKQLQLSGEVFHLLTVTTTHTEVAEECWNSGETETRRGKKVRNNFIIQRGQKQSSVCRICCWKGWFKINKIGALMPEQQQSNKELKTLLFCRSHRRGTSAVVERAAWAKMRTSWRGSVGLPSNKTSCYIDARHDLISY